MNTKELKEKFFKRFPEWQKRTRICTIDGDDYPECVLDDLDYDEWGCTRIKQGITEKKYCPDWNLPQREPAFFMPGDIWGWIETELLNNNE